MQIHLNQLKINLTKQLFPAYWLSSDESLLLQEARDMIKLAAKNAGFIQHELLTIDPSFDWQNFEIITQNFGLFSEKTLIDLRNPNTKFDAGSTKILLHYLQNLSADQLLIISTPKLTAAEKNSTLYKTVDKTAATVTIWPISSNELPQWIQGRMKQANLCANKESIHLLSELTEGNLLSTQQAIEKLALLYPHQLITPNEITTVTCDNARFNIFDLANQALQGDTKRISRTVDKLAQENCEPVLVLWALVREIRHLIKLKQQVQQGMSLQNVVAKEWTSRKPLITVALKRLSLSSLYKLLQQASDIDRCIKGFAVGNSWNKIRELAFAFAGIDTTGNYKCLTVN